LTQTLKNYLNTIQHFHPEGTSGLTTESNDNNDLLRRLPLKQRILTKLMLKIPVPRIPFFVTRTMPEIEGIFHGLILPLLLSLMMLLMVWLLPTVTLLFGFPLNLFLTLLVPASVFIAYVRIELERTINWWKSVFDSPIEWDSSKSVKELIELLKKQRNKAKTN